MELSASYDPKIAESKWYAIWEKEGLFHGDENDSQDAYSIVIPPPNVTGNLHMGHALNNTLQDILIRWQRMNGKATCWMPGMDHAGIATQNVVERLLLKEGKTKYDLGRDEFVKRVWDWKEHSGGQIKEQLKRLGCSLDWVRERFTLDQGLSHAVRTVFVTLYKEGLIYQGYRIINWCPRCETALSDIETEYKDLSGKLYYIHYPYEEGDGHITVATTRPETMLGDTAVAVNPNDSRYAHLIGKNVILPLMNRPIPIIADEFVDPAFGTGLVKVTPAHDPNDFEMGKRHNLEEVNILDKNAIINENGGIYKGLDRYQARQKVCEDLKTSGLLEKIEDHNHAVGHCYRCHTVIEPYLSKQWFIKIEPLAKDAIKVVEEGKIRFIPSSWAKIYFEWMYNIKDWCISRQLWWGHRIPAFYCKDCGYIMVELEDPAKCTMCNSKNIEQDPDVLDTWFSSALWPFSTFGWPQKTKSLEKFYPTSVLVTGFDIIFFWVARMIMMGCKFMNDVPFYDVYIHALVRDEHGQKMSKSRGNVIDPLIMMEKYGTDAFRFTLAIFAAQGRDIILSEKRIEGYSAFCNKIWNSTRFILMNLGNDFKPEAIDVNSLELFDKWILHAFSQTVKKTTQALVEYRFNDAAQTLYDFWWHEFCDWYIELSKPRIYAGDSLTGTIAKQVLYFVLHEYLKLLHPFMPFITEEIWCNITSNEGRIVMAPWPQYDERLNFENEFNHAELFKKIVYKIRNIRGEMNVPPDKKAHVVIKADKKIEQFIRQQENNLKILAKLETVDYNTAYTAQKTDASAVLPECEIYVPLKDLIDLEKEKARLGKEIARVQGELDKVLKKLNDSTFMAKAPQSIIDKEQNKKAELEELCAKLATSREKLG
ncbi:MAG: valine--tRNA ligase [Spirochaetota bacterium]